MVRMTDERNGAVAAGLIGLLVAMVAVLASAADRRSSEPSSALGSATERRSGIARGVSAITVPLTAASTTSTTATAIPATVPATTRWCTAADLRLTFGSEAEGVMRQSAAYFGLENTSRRACKLQGYPVVHFFDHTGQPIKTQMWKGGGYIIQDPRSATVALPPKATGWFGLNWVVENVKAGNLTGCVEPVAIGVTPPGSSGQLRLDIDLQAPPCLVDGFGVTALSPGAGFGGAFAAPTPGS